MSVPTPGQYKAWFVLVNMCPDMKAWLKPEHISPDFEANIEANENLLKRLDEHVK